MRIRCRAAMAAATIWLMLGASGLHSQAMNVTIEGVRRQALVIAPSQAARSAEPLPLVFAFHGHGGSMVQAAGQMRLDKAWPEAVVVYMQGLPTKTAKDPDGAEAGWQQQPGELGDRDVKFFDGALAELRKRFPVDANRVYATGFSNGGQFAYLLWGLRAKELAGLAAVAAEKFPGVHLSVPLPLLHIAGERDYNIPIEKQLETMASARQANGSGELGRSCGEYCKVYDAGGAPVMTLIHPGGHVFPRYASQMIAEFLRQHRRGEIQPTAERR